MKKIDQYIITKGHYEHSQIRGLVSVKQYIFARVDGKKCLVLRLLNETDFKINSIKFVVLQLNAVGEVIDSTPVEHNNITFMPGALMSFNSGVIVSEKCADFKVQLISVQSGKYEYCIKDGDTVAVYYNLVNVWRRRLARSSEYVVGLKAGSKRPKTFGFFGFVAAICILAMCFISFWPYLQKILP